MSKQAFTRVLLALPFLAGPALAQEEGVTIATAESEEHGIYLADGKGRSVYLFERCCQGDAA